MNDKENKKVSKSFVTGVIALVFLVIGYQTALFVQKAAVAIIVAHKDKPDTVWVDVTQNNEAHSVYNIANNKQGYTSYKKHKPISQQFNRQENNKYSYKVYRKSANHSTVATSIAKQFSCRKVHTFRFNPNTVSLEDLMLLGFSQKQAQSIINYRLKGGRYRRKQDFASSFVVADSVYHRLEPYIDIPKIDINKADSATFKSIYGIGAFLASKLVSYRQSLGGYSYLEQIMDIKYIDIEKFNSIKEFITISISKPYPFWALSADSLALHPYISKNMARSIQFYKQNNPSDKWTIVNLLHAGVIDEDTYKRLIKCKLAP